MLVDLEKLNLGSDSAERDITVGLSEYFYQNSTYQKFLNSKKTILVGNRGTGKSAIFKYIASTEAKKGHLVLELSPEEYSYELLSQYLKRENEGAWGKQSSYSVAWQYLLYNLIFNKIVENKRGLLLGVQRDIYNYVNADSSMKGLSPIGVLVSYLKKLETVKLDAHESIAKSRNLQALYSLEEIKNLIPSLKKVLEKSRMKVLIDELDKGWDDSEDAKYFHCWLVSSYPKNQPGQPSFASIRFHSPGTL